MPNLKLDKEAEEAVKDSFTPPEVIKRVVQGPPGHVEMNKFMNDFTSEDDNYINFSIAVEQYSMDNDCSLTDALLELMEKYDIDFSDIRKAISYPINRAEMTNIIHRDLYKIIDHPIFYKMGIWCNPDIIRYNYDIEKAEEYMRIAGYDIGEPSGIFGIRLNLISLLVTSTIILIVIQKKKKVEGKLRQNLLL